MVKTMRANREYQIYESVSKYMKLQWVGVLYRFDMAGLNLSKTQAGQSKNIQWGRAYPDFFILKAMDPWHGLFLEIKKEGTSLFKKDGLTMCTPHLTEQQLMIDRLNGLNYRAKFSIGLDQCIFDINEYLKIK